jgi:hypothetical protein
MALKLSQPSIQGRVAVGEKSEKGYPKKLDYFVFTKPFDEKTKSAPKDAKMLAIMKEKYKTDQPKEIHVILVDHHPEEVFFTAYMNYPGSSCNCKGDGEKGVRTGSDGTKVDVVCNYDECKFRWLKKDKGMLNTCKPTGVLTFLIPEAPRAGGLWKFTTHSKMSIGKINEALWNIYNFRKTLFGLKVILKVKMVQISLNGQTQNVPTVEVEVPFSLDEIAEGAGTKVGTLLDAQTKHIQMGTLPNKEKLQELSMEAEKLGNPNTTSEKVLDVQIVDNSTISESVVSSEQEPEFDF